MDGNQPAIRLMIFLTEDDLVGHRTVADVLLERASKAGLAGATIWQGIEGFGEHGHLRSMRLPDLARGLPLVVEIIDLESTINDFVGANEDLIAGTLITTEQVQLSRPSPLGT